MALVFAASASIYLAWMFTYVWAVNYALDRKEMILDGGPRTRAFVEDNKGLLSAREVASDHGRLAPWLEFHGVSDDDLEGMDATLIEYSLLGAYFTVIYDGSGNVFGIVENGI